MSDDRADALGYLLHAVDGGPVITFDYHRVLREKIAESFVLPRALLRPRCPGRVVEARLAAIDKALNDALFLGAGAAWIGMDEAGDEPVFLHVPLHEAASDEG